MILLQIYTFVVLASAILEFVLSAPYPAELADKATEYLVANEEASENVNVTVISRILSNSNSTYQAQLLESSAYEDKQASFFNNHEIVFPDSYDKFFKPISRIEGTPECADGLSLCENIDQYPYTRIRNILQRASKHNEFFGVDEVSPELADRVGDLQDEYLCGSIEETIFPKAGKNKNNKWKFIINQDDRYVQGIRVEKCVKLNSPCNLLADAPLGYVTTCKQKYVLRRLLSVNDNDQQEPDSFYIPSACCCSFKKDANFLTDFGRSNTPALPPTR